jgi:hypothetical protein
MLVCILYQLAGCDEYNGWQFWIFWLAILSMLAGYAA